LSEGHPDPETLEHYARGELGREPRRDLERHLAGCPGCQAAVDRIPVPVRGEDSGGGTVRWQGHRFAARRAAHEEGEERRQSVDGLLAVFGPLIAAVSRGELADLLAADELRRRTLIRDEPRFRSLALCELLQERCRSLWVADPEAAVESAKLAVLITERLAAEGGAEPVAEARAMALMHLGNAFRIAAEQRERLTPQVAEAAVTGEVGAGSEIGEAVPSWEAESALWELRDAFLARKMGFAAVLVCLDLARSFLRQGREDDLRRMVGESIPLFAAQGAEPFVIDALRFLRDEKVREGRPLSLELVDKMARFLEEARHDPRRAPL
jgi:hypothetical protein